MRYHIHVALAAENTVRRCKDPHHHCSDNDHGYVAELHLFPFQNGMRRQGVELHQSS